MNIPRHSGWKFSRNRSRSLNFLLLPVFLLVSLPAIAQTTQSSPREFPPGLLNRLDQLPVTRLREQIDRLPLPAQTRALQWLRSFHFTELDLNSLHADAEGAIFYADTFEGVPAEEAETPAVSEVAVPVQPFPAHLNFHSKPGARNVLYLDFAGEDVSGTAWNSSLSRTVIPALAFSTDSDFSTFSDAEQAAIKRVWQRIAEDYSPFDVDVTTERPATLGPNVAHVLITRNTDANGAANPSSSAGGVAYVNVFGTTSYPSYRPAWVYFNNLANNESYIAEAASHEAGHNLGLSHDGTTSSSYYNGHGSGDISWAPLMGTGYNRNVSQWSKGEYYLANNTQDDLTTIAGKLSYRSDDHGNTQVSATTLMALNGTNILSTTPENDPGNTNRLNKGILERATDVDVFSFVTGAGNIDLQFRPWINPSGTRGGNLDLVAELYDDSGKLLLSSNPALQTTAQIQTNLPQGRYYVHLKNSAAGSPLTASPTGYTSYGSIGQYFINGTIAPAVGFVSPPVAELNTTDVTLPGQTAKQLTVTYSDDLGINVATLDSGDIRVTGPGGFDSLAQLVTIDNPTDGSPRVATYSVQPPSGAVWLPADNGTYLVFLRSNQVADLESAWASGVQLGEFKVAVPVPIYAANMDSNPNWTLEPDWQYGRPQYVSGGPTAGFTGTNIIGFNLGGNYADQLQAKYATTPVINCSGAASLTLRFRRWLRTKNNDPVAIQVTTNGTVWQNVWSSSGAISDSSWQEVQYALPAGVAGSSTVRLRWSLASGQKQNDIGWNIDDVQLLGDGQFDTTAPVAIAAISEVTSAGTAPHPCTVTFTDTTAISIASLNTGDILVTGPNGYSNWVEFTGVDLPGDGSPCTASYLIAAPGGTWDINDNGTYQLTLVENAVEDVFNNAMPSTTLGTFDVAVPASQQRIIVSASSITVPEGSTAEFNVSLAEPPAEPLTVNVAWVSGDPDITVVVGATHQFTSADWSTPKVVQLTALPDSNQETEPALFECQAPGLTPVAITGVTQPGVHLTLTANNSAWGTVSPANGTYPAGQAVQLTATCGTYFRFVGWTGDIIGTNNPLPVVLNSDLAAGAVFEEISTTNTATPLWWLAAHGYTNNFDVASSSIGANGLPLWQSYVAGLDPNDPESQLRGAGLLPSDGQNHVLSWNTVEGRIYTLWSSPDAVTGFAPIPEATDLPWTVRTFTNVLGDGPATRFYRIQVELP